MKNLYLIFKLLFWYVFGSNLLFFSLLLLDSLNLYEINTGFVFAFLVNGVIYKLISNSSNEGLEMLVPFLGATIASLILQVALSINPQINRKIRRGTFIITFILIALLVISSFITS